MRGLYLVTPNWTDTGRMLACTRAALEGGAALVQYRNKDAGAELRREQATELLALCRQYARPLVINDHLALCAELDADGVHVGGTDASVPPTCTPSASSSAHRARWSLMTSGRAYWRHRASSSVACSRRSSAPASLLRYWTRAAPPSRAARVQASMRPVSVQLGVTR